MMCSWHPWIYSTPFRRAPTFSWPLVSLRTARNMSLGRWLLVACFSSVKNHNVSGPHLLPNVTTHAQKSLCNPRTVLHRTKNHFQYQIWVGDVTFVSFFCDKKIWRVTFVTFLGRMWRSRTRKYFFNLWRFLSHPSRKTSHFGTAGTKLFWTGKMWRFGLDWKMHFSSRLRFLTYLGSVKREGHLGYYAGRRTDFRDKKSSDFSGEIFRERNYYPRTGFSGSNPGSI